MGAMGRHLRAVRFLLSLAAAVAFCMTTAVAAVADNDVVITRPLAGERLDARPDAVTVVLTEPFQGTARLAVQADDGTTVSIEPAKVVSTNIAVQLPPDLAPGVYTVTFRTDTGRGPEGGRYQFAYQSSSPMTIDGVSRWRDYENIPEIVAEPGDAAAADGSRTNESESTPATPSADPSGTADTPAATESPSGSAGATWWWPVIGAVVLVLGGVWFVWARRRGQNQ